MNHTGLFLGNLEASAREQSWEEGVWVTASWHFRWPPF